MSRHAPFSATTVVETVPHRKPSVSFRRSGRNSTNQQAAWATRWRGTFCSVSADRRKNAPVVVSKRDAWNSKPSPSPPPLITATAHAFASSPAQPPGTPPRATTASIKWPLRSPSLHPTGAIRLWPGDNASQSRAKFANSAAAASSAASFSGLRAAWAWFSMTSFSASTRAAAAAKALLAASKGGANVPPALPKAWSLLDDARAANRAAPRNAEATSAHGSGCVEAGASNSRTPCQSGSPWTSARHAPERRAAGA